MSPMRILQWTPALVLIISFLNPTLASALSMELTRFGTCLTPPGGCAITINDNLAGDLNPAAGVIDFAAVVGQIPDGVFIATGRVIETITQDAAGRVTGILLNLTNTTVQGVAGGVGAPPAIAGEIGVLSTLPLVSLNGVTGFAGLNGQYQNPTGTIGFASLSLAARVDGCLVGQVVPPAAVNASSPVPFAGLNSRTCPFPVDNLLIGTLDFSVAPGDGFFLPTSAESFAAPVPEPTTLLLFGTVMTGLGLVARHRERHRHDA
jgi:PEP-CTERM motif